MHVPAQAEPAAARAPRAAAGNGPLAPPPDRAELLARLRDRAGRLPAERVEAILASRR
jgi:hypothetical protein